jgi:glycosyltransferase involved in cell wall biosynthesis
MTMTRVAVGIAVHAEPERFRATLHAVRRTVPPSVHLLAVTDRPDAATAAMIERLGIDVLAAHAPGGAASLNRLLGGTEADVCVLLESGCIPAPGWLQRLLAGLDADPRNGFAGPSTNRAWNEQGAAPACGPGDAVIEAAARRLAALHGDAAKTLEPLYSLADFCYAVRRAAWDEAGAADEGYGAGPCWEMDYNARAARAGWRGVWVPAAFVWRAPFTLRRAADERRLFEPNRRRYQDRLCALRLRGERRGYEPHCRGDACEHFAPAGLIQLRIAPPAFPAPLPHPTVEPEAPVVASDAETEEVSRRVSGASREQPPLTLLTLREQNSVESRERVIDTDDAAPAPSPGSVEDVDAPLISCIMPTRGRPELALQAVRYFQAQDYPHRELVILDDAGGTLGPLLPDDPRIRYTQVGARQSIGAKRNRGVQLARGQLVAHWDDDDWYAPDRLSAQAAPILEGRADVTALRCDVFFDLARWEFWGCDAALHRRLFVHDVHGGTLMFRRTVWGGRVRYPHVSLAEDAYFLMHAVRNRARLVRVDAPGLFVYLRHGANAWSFVLGRHVDTRGWLRVDEPPHLAPDRAFYAARSPAAPPPSTARPSGPPAAPASPPAVLGAEEEAPLVSCLMPTADRRRFVPRAIQHFLRQTYPARELVIVDDGAEPVRDLVPDDPRIRYVRAERSASLGAKRNLACSLASGALLAHWDDDDWMRDDRLALQVAALRRARADVCGLSVIRYFDPVRSRAWEYRWKDRARGWVAGNTLLYRREAWERRPFPGLNEGEDTRWVFNLPRLHAMTDPSWFAGMVHAGNTSHKHTRGPHWHPLDLAVVRDAMAEDWDFYAAMASPSRALAAV